METPITIGFPIENDNFWIIFRIPHFQETLHKWGRWDVTAQLASPGFSSLFRGSWDCVFGRRGGSEIQTAAPAPVC